MTRTVAFFSYTRHDDEDSGGRLSFIREELERKLRSRMGEPVRVFQDVNDIKTGKPWEDELDKALSGSTLLVCMVTPSFFKSGPCQDELTKFRAREKALGRDDLVIPVYWIADRMLEGKAQKTENGDFVAGRQWADWRDFYTDPTLPREALQKHIIALVAVIVERLHELDEASSKTAPPAEKSRPAPPAAPAILKPAMAKAEPIRDPKPLEQFRDPLAGGGEGPVMAMLPAGEFWMGSPDDEEGREEDEERRLVKIKKPFAIGVYPVTVGEYLQFCTIASHSLPNEISEEIVIDGGDLPITYIDFTDARKYCSWLSRQTGQNYRLPFEQEWEYACRAGSRTPYSMGVTALFSGDFISRREARFGMRDFDMPLPVNHSGFRPNAWGLMQMHGNVDEWTQTGWEGNYVLRGGNFCDDESRIRSASRRLVGKHRKWNSVGFRVARGEVSYEWPSAPNSDTLF